MNTILTQALSTNARNWAPVSLRLGVGTVMAAHGAQKLFGWWGGYGLQGTATFFGETLGMKPGLLWASLASGGEFFGGLALLLGLATRFFALNTVVIMAVAIASVHSGAFFAQNNGMEFPLTLLLAAVALVFTGGGALSIDARLAPIKVHSS
ncbi:DoxX family protein [Opitutaceae bacterium]